MKRYKQIYKFFLGQLDMPKHKIKYLLNADITMLYGCFSSIKNYGGTLDTDTFDIFCDVISGKLSGSEDVEYEFEENEYKNLMSIKKYFID